MELDHCFAKVASGFRVAGNQRNSHLFDAWFPAFVWCRPAAGGEILSAQTVAIHVLFQQWCVHYTMFPNVIDMLKQRRQLTSLVLQSCRTRSSVAMTASE